MRGASSFMALMKAGLSSCSKRTVWKSGRIRKTLPVKSCDDARGEPPVEHIASKTVAAASERTFRAKLAFMTASIA